MPGPFDWAMALTGQEPNGNPYDQIGALGDQMQTRNRLAVGLDANGNPLPAPPANGAPPAGGAPTALASSGAMQPQQEPNATKTPPSMVHLMTDLTQYQEREQQFNQGLGGIGAAFSRPENRSWVKGLFNVNQVDPLKLTQQAMDISSQQQGQDRTNALGQMIYGPGGEALAKSLNFGSWDQLKAAYEADPGGIGKIVADYNQQIPAIKGVQQITNLQGSLKAGGANDSEIALLTPSLVADLGPEFAKKAIQDAGSYRASHNGKAAPWVGANGINVAAYDMWSSTQRAIKANQIDTASTAAGQLASTNTLRQKLSNLANSSDLKRVLALPGDSAEKIAFQHALDYNGDDWKQYAITQGLTDPGAMTLLSELKEINGKEYRGAIESILGHGLRPSTQEVTAVRSGFGQTNRAGYFSNMDEFKAQAIDPLMTYLDEAQAKLYGDRGDIENAPERVRAFIDPVYLTGGSMRLDNGQAPLDWEKDVNKPLPPADEKYWEGQLQKQPQNAFHIRDQLRRQGYRVEF